MSKPSCVTLLFKSHVASLFFYPTKEYLPIDSRFSHLIFIVLLMDLDLFLSHYFIF
jgi:hypothetical protein